MLERTLLSIFIFFSTVSSIEGLPPAILYPDGAICLRYLVTHNFFLISAHLEEAAITVGKSALEREKGEGDEASSERQPVVRRAVWLPRPLPSQK